MSDRQVICDGLQDMVPPEFVVEPISFLPTSASTHIEIKRRQGFAAVEYAVLILEDDEAWIEKRYPSTGRVESVPLSDESLHNLMKWLSWSLSW